MTPYLASFQHFGLPHCVAIAVTVLAGILSICFLRSQPSPRAERLLRCSLASALLLAVSLDPILTLKRYGTGELGWKMLMSNSLPCYLCDVVSILLAIALIFKTQACVEIGYLWALAGTLQGLLTPTLTFSWDTPEYYAFFLQHGGAPVAAVSLVWGMRIYPQSAAFKRVMTASLLYMAITITYNHFAGQNYGFLNGKPEHHTLFDYLGPYPYYLLSLLLFAAVCYWLLLALARWTQSLDTKK